MRIKFWLLQGLGWLPYFLLQLLVRTDDQPIAAATNLLSALALSALAVAGSVGLRAIYRRLQARTWGELRWMAVLLAASIAMAMFVDAGYYAGLWLLPLVTLTDLLQKFRATMEHRPLHEDQGVAPESGYYGSTPGQLVRSVRASLWERLFLCKLNFGFHAEHHLWPQVSYQYLPALRARLESAGAFSDPRYGREETYFAALYRLWRPGPSRSSQTVS